MNHSSSHLPPAAMDPSAALMDPSAPAGQRKKIAILATGGTIAGKGKPGQAALYKAGEMPVSAILDSLEDLSLMADLKLIDICALDSNDITFDHYARIQQLVRELEADPDVDGIVITHGTDTLEESAFLLNLVLDVHKPVIFTGAMRPASAVSADGPMNLYQAIALACHPSAQDTGVLAVLSNTIYAGRDLEKLNSIKTDAFRSESFGAVGFMSDDQVHLLQTPHGLYTHQSPFCHLSLKEMPQVEIFYVHQQSDPRLLEYMLETYDGIVLAGSGSGNYPKAIQEVITRYEGNKPIVRSSRLIDGVAFDSPEFDPAQKTIPSYRLSPHKARLLLMLGLKANGTLQQLRDWFASI